MAGGLYSNWFRMRDVARDLTMIEHLQRPIVSIDRAYGSGGYEVNLRGTFYAPRDIYFFDNTMQIDEATIERTIPMIVEKMLEALGDGDIDINSAILPNVYLSYDFEFYADNSEQIQEMVADTMSSQYGYGKQSLSPAEIVLYNALLSSRATAKILTMLDNPLGIFLPMEANCEVMRDHRFDCEIMEYGKPRYITHDGHRAMWINVSGKMIVNIQQKKRGSRMLTGRTMKRTRLMV